MTTLPVLMYHSVTPSDANGPLEVPRDTVARQWRALRADGWTMLGLTEALATLKADPSARVIGLTFDDGYADFLGVLDLLAAHDARATLYLPTSQLEQDPDIRPLRYLTWTQTISLPRELVELGSHAHVHRPLDILPKDDVAREIQRSRRLLAMHAGIDAMSFCYPNGYSSRAVRRAVSAAGYANACIVGRRIADPSGDQYALPRLQVTSAHDEARILNLVTVGETGPKQKIKHIAGPSWRLSRWAVYRITGRILT